MQKWSLIGLGLFAAGLAPTVGCAWADPGGQVARGLGQSKTYQWGADGNFSAVGQGTQTESFCMMEGDIAFQRKDGKLLLDKGGNPVPDMNKTKVRYYLRADPKADDAANAMGQALAASTAQAAILGQTITGMFNAVIPLLTRPAAATAADTGTAGGNSAAMLQRLDRLLSLLEASRGLGPP